MKFLKFALTLILVFSTLVVFGQKTVQLKTSFSYENFEGKIPNNYAFTYGETENGHTEHNITEASTIYDILEKYSIPVKRLNPTMSNYQFWVEKYKDREFNHPYKKAILIDLMAAMKPELAKR